MARASGALATMVGALNVRRVVAMFGGDFETARLHGVAEEVAKEGLSAAAAAFEPTVPTVQPWKVPDHSQVLRWSDGFPCRISDEFQGPSRSILVAGRR